jgi:RNA polymerase sigma factor (sigma-70 family)
MGLRIQAVTICKDGSALRQLKTLFNVGATRELSDGELLEWFSTGRGDVAEPAFQAIVERHGAMVLRVCRAQLLNPDDAQDAFQATFLILLKKARSLWVRDSLGPWLHQVAFRTACCARSAVNLRRKHERRAAELAASADGQSDRAELDLETVLHEEINRLPECYRVPIVLCDLEGLTCEEAARRMGRPVGTVKSWRFRGRARLHERLTRRRVAPSIGPAPLVADSMRALWTETSLRAAVVTISDSMALGKVSESERVLVKGVLRTMFLCKLRTMIIAFACLAVGLGAVTWVAANDSNKALDETSSKTPRPAVTGELRAASDGIEKTGEQCALALDAAIRIGLQNADEVRVISVGGSGTPSTISPRGRRVGIEKFKAEVMGRVRSIEQQYWSLAQANVAVGSAVRAVELAQEIADRQASELGEGRGTVADVAEANQRLEQFKLDLVTKTSDVKTAERVLRDVLGSDPDDGRRIVPITVPTKDLVKPDWEKCKAVMLEKQPEIVRMRALVKEAESDVSTDGLIHLERRKEYLAKVISQATHSLARFFLELDANHKQVVTAARLRAAAAVRLEKQAAFYDEGRITIDRFLDALGQYATAVATEAQYVTTYNNSITALEEAKGTLLERDRISVVAGPKSANAIASVTDWGVEGEWYEPSRMRTRLPQATVLPPGSSARLPVSRPRKSAEEEKSASPKVDPVSKTVSFQFTIGKGSKPLEVRGSFTITPAQADRAPQNR